MASPRRAADLLEPLAPIAPDGMFPMRRLLLALVAPAVVVLALVVFAPAAGIAAPTASPTPIGRWDREDGLGGIRIDRCGDALCGFVIWLRDPNGPSRIGERVLYDMRQTAADTWSGSAHNPEDGHEYAGTIRLDGDRLVTRGCVLAGMICRSVPLLRGR